MKRTIALLITLCMTVTLFSACVSNTPPQTTSTPASTPATTSGSVAPAGDVITIKLSCDNNSGGPWDLGLKHFMELVEEKIPGRVEFQYYPDAQLSNNDQRVTMEMLQTGTIHMAVFLPAIYEQFDQRWQVYSLPYLFTDIEEARASCDGEAGQYMLSLLAEKQIHGLALWEQGWRHLTTTNTEVHLPADVAGLKIRVMDSPTYIEMFNQLSALPTVTSMGELFTALQQNAVDGQENPLTTIARRKFDEVQDYLIMTHHSYSPLIFGANKPFFDGLPDDVKQAITEAAIETTAFERQCVEDEDTMWTEELQKTMTFIYLTEEEMQAWKDATAGVVDAVRASIGDDILSMFGK